MKVLKFLLAAPADAFLPNDMFWRTMITVNFVRGGRTLNLVYTDGNGRATIPGDPMIEIHKVGERFCPTDRWTVERVREFVTSGWHVEREIPTHNR